MEGLQLSQVLADLSNINAAEAETAAAIVNANSSISHSHSHPNIQSGTPAPDAHDSRPSAIKRAWSTENGQVDRLGRRIVTTSNGSRSGSATNSIPGTPRRGDIDLDDDLERASTLMALYDIRAKLKQQDNSSLLKAREKINALAARQQAQQSLERNNKTTEQLRRNRYSFPKPGL